MLPERNLIRKNGDLGEFYPYSEGWRRNLSMALCSRVYPSLVSLSEV